MSPGVTHSLERSTVWAPAGIAKIAVIAKIAIIEKQLRSPKALAESRPFKILAILAILAIFFGTLFCTPLLIHFRGKTKVPKIQRAILSVTDKTGIVEFATK